MLYNPDAVTFHKVIRSENDSLQYVLQKVETEMRYKIIQGELALGSSLNDMLLESEVPHDLTQIVNGVLLCKISFRTDARAGPVIST